MEKETIWVRNPETGKLRKVTKFDSDKQNIINQQIDSNNENLERINNYIKKRQKDKYYDFLEKTDNRSNVFIKIVYLILLVILGVVSYFGAYNYYKKNSKPPKLKESPYDNVFSSINTNQKNKEKVEKTEETKEDYKYIFDETKRIFSEQGINLTMDEFHKAKTLKRSI